MLRQAGKGKVSYLTVRPTGQYLGVGNRCTCSIVTRIHETVTIPDSTPPNHPVIYAVFRIQSQYFQTPSTDPRRGSADIVFYKELLGKDTENW